MKASLVNYKSYPQSYPEAIKGHKKRALEIHLSARYHLWSGKRDSNPRLSAWEADTLPTELFPHLVGAV